MDGRAVILNQLAQGIHPLAQGVDWDADALRDDVRAYVTSTSAPTMAC
ncbi:hypothetical protein [Streptomyces sp. NPDC016675]